MKIEHEMNPDLRRLGDFFSEIETFNQEHSSARKMASVLFSALLSPMREEQTETGSPKLSENHHMDKVTTQAQGIFDKHLVAINRLGINIELNRGQADEQSLKSDFPEHVLESPTPANLIREDRLELGVVDEFKLLAFFKSLKAADLESEGARSVLSIVAKELDQNIIRSYIFQYLDKEDEQAQKLFEMSGEIASELRRLGLTVAANVLVHHLEHVWQGDLREFLIAETGMILPGEGFRPHNWHQDSLPDHYRPCWEKALEALDQVAENPRAKAIFKEAYHYLRGSIETANEHFTAVERSDNKAHYQISDVEEFRQILAEASARLNQFGYE